MNNSHRFPDSLDLPDTNFDYRILRQLRNDMRCSKFDAIHAGETRVILYIGYSRYMLNQWDKTGKMTNTPSEVSITDRLRGIAGVPAIHDHGFHMETDIMYYSIESDETMPLYKLMNGAMPWSRRDCFKQVFEVVYKAAFTCGVYHGCLSTEYVFLNGDKKYQVTGWQLSKLAPPQTSEEFRIWTTSTPMVYCAPETFYAKTVMTGSYRPEFQLVWNLGVFFYQLYFGTTPYSTTQVSAFADAVWVKSNVIRAMELANEMENSLFDKIAVLPTQVRYIIWNALTLMDDRRICLSFLKECVDKLVVEE